MSPQLDTVRLRNGAEEFRPFVALALLAFRALMKENPIAFYELVSVARDRHHRIFGGPDGFAAKTLKRTIPGLRVREDGTAQLHDSDRNVLLSAVTGEAEDGSDWVLLPRPYAQAHETDPES